jgi:hypothetical protein
MLTSSSTLSSTSQASQQHPSTQSFQHALLPGQEQQQQQQPNLSCRPRIHRINRTRTTAATTTKSVMSSSYSPHQQQQQQHPNDVAAMNVNTTTNHTIMWKRNSMQFDEWKASAIHDQQQQ